MVKPVNERVTKCRQKKIAEDAQPLSIWLDATSVKRLASLRKYYGLNFGGKWTKTRLISEAIKVLHQTTFNDTSVS
jgi:hypothetical protein